MRQQGFRWFNIPNQLDNTGNFPISVPQSAYQWIRPPAVTDLLGVSGHSSADPASLFGNHKVVEIDGVFYDPSYGNSFTSLQAFENNSVVGYMTMGDLSEVDTGFDFNGGGLSPNFRFNVFLFRKKVEGQIGLEFE